MRQDVDLVIRGGLVLPMTGSFEAERGEVVIDRGRVVAVGPGAGAAFLARQDLDASGAAVLPGFVQCHVHVVQSLLRHQADGLELLDWLTRRTWPYEAALDGDGVEAAAVLGIAELLAGGTTTALDLGTTHDHERVFEVADRLGIRLVSGKTHMDVGDGVPPGLLEDTERSLADAEALGRRWHGAADGRLRYAVAPRFVLSCSRELLLGCRDLARANGWLLHSHASENRDEVRAVRAASGRSYLAALDDVGLTGGDVVLAHGVHLEDEEVAILARTGTTICHCPGANLKLASGIADVPRLLAAGVRVALGADGPPCNNRLSMFHEMSLAATLHGLRHGPTALSAWRVLELATREGAAALGLEDEIGTLQPGKAADVIVVDLGGWHTLPGGDPAARLVHGAVASDVRHVVVSGRLVVVEGRPTTFDPALERQRVDAAWRATAARLKEQA